MELPASQASSHFSLEPITAFVLADREVKRRDAAVGLGLCKTGCPELDNYVLLGGLERGSVVGLSAEDEEIGVQLGLQTLAHGLCREGSLANGLVITPKPAAAILGGLRGAVRAELRETGAADGEALAKTRECLDRVMLSCVFDLDGLWEVLADLDRPSEEDEDRDEGEAGKSGQETVEEKEVQVDEIADSQDEDDEPLSPDVGPQQPSPPQRERRRQPKLPDLIIITHFSSLLTSLFTHREKSAAHSALQLLGAHIRHLARNLPSSPMILLLNSTSSSSTATPAQSAALSSKKQQPLDPTLRSIFNPPPPPGYAPHAGAASSRRNKPSFGLVFSQLLHVHLLLTQLPRSIADAETAAAAFRHQADAPAARAVWVVEVLLDDMGVWEGRKGARRDREQRWTAVDVDRGRVKGAFVKTEKVAEETRLAGGFGGRRV
ncbi:hypothetical protein B0T10DRAFT_558325 [Thelonectria olida]|uniref:Uncharacterized protein n=1 Tax=Thelonectria olida TaxID=1576542 RepID=A0A9P9AVB0_9HYPO|nr:hypothetical protein B0T10DRAFT_558325 [Thelonectria olida]